MKKSLGIIVVALAMLYPVAAWLMGYPIEQRANDVVREMSGKSPYIRVIDSHFRRGWFVSDQDITVQTFPNTPLRATNAPEAPTALATPLRFTIHNVIHHGPLCGISCVGLAGFDTHVVYNDQVQRYLASIFGSAEPLVIRSRLGFFGGGTAHIASPVVNDVTLHDGSHVASSGFTLDGRYGANYDSYVLHGALPHLLYNAADGSHAEVSEARIDIDSTRALRSLYTGTTSASVGRIAYGGSAGTGDTSLRDIVVTSHSAVTDGFMSATTRFSAGTLVTAALTLTGAHFDLTFRHIELESLEQLTAASQQQPNQVPLPPLARITTLLATVKGPAIALLSHQPEISLDRISLATAAGSALLTGVIKIHDIGADDFSGANPMALVQKIDADLELTADEAFLTSVPGGANAMAQYQGFASQGLLTHEGGKFHTKIAFHQGQLTFNGKPLQAFGPPAAH